MRFPSATVATSWATRMDSLRHFWEVGRSRDYQRTNRRGSERRHVKRPENTSSFSYRPNQIADPYNFSFNTTSQANDYGCSNPGHQTLDCWVNQAASVAPPLAPGEQSAHSFGNARIGNLRGPGLVSFDFVLQEELQDHRVAANRVSLRVFQSLQPSEFWIAWRRLAGVCGRAGRCRDHEHGN